MLSTIPASSLKAGTITLIGGVNGEAKTSSTAAYERARR